MSQQLHDLVDFIVRALVDRPEAVQVRDAGTGRTSVLELRVAPDDLGKVIGKKGGTARAIRTVLFVAAGRCHRRAVLNIVEE